MIRRGRTAILTQWTCLIAAVAPLNAARPQPAADSPATHGFVDMVFKDASGDHKYVVFVPQRYSPEQKWPVILYLHGAGARGTDGRLQISDGLGPYVKAHADTFSFIVVFPQNENVQGRILTGWSADSIDGRRAIAILGEVEKQFSVDRTREILTGYSQGGYGAWSLASATPERWAAVVPVAGGGSPSSAFKLKDTPVWAFHGTSDLAVRVEESRRMVEAIQAAGGKLRYTEIRDVGHEIWKSAYFNEELYEWMLSPTTEEPTRSSGVTLSSQRHFMAPVPDTNEPFVPAVIVPQAVYVRMGNDALKTLADSIPRSLPPDMLTGRLKDHTTYTTLAGRRYRIDFTRIQYHGQLTRAQIQAQAKDRLNIRLGLENATITIGNTFVLGGNRSATAGPINVVLGHRRPVWLNLDVMPVVEHHKLRLKSITVQFSIANDNWYVTSPASVSTHRLGPMRGLGPRHGLRLVRNRISSNLVSGLYSRKAEIEAQVQSIVPSIIRHLEENLDFGEASKLVGNMWPLPVYEPRVQLWPEEIATDETGVSLVMALAATAPDPRRSPDSPTIAEPVGLPANKIPHVAELRFGIAPNAMQALTGFLVQADVARIHLLDMPGNAFEPMATAETLAEAIPDLKRYGTNVKIRAELSLAEPITVDDGRGTVARSDGDGGVPVLDFRFPRIAIAYAIETDPSQSTSIPFAEFDFHLSQYARATLNSNLDQRIMRIDWLGDATVKANGRFASSYQPTDHRINMERIEQLFARGWWNLTHADPVLQASISDVDLRFAKLRAADIDWTSPYLSARYKPLAITSPTSAKTAYAAEVVPLVYQRLELHPAFHHHSQTIRIGCSWRVD
jgi:poly(3-hydroxybutyrate) depolymerase